MDSLDKVRTSGQRLRNARDHQNSILASHAWDMWVADRNQRASRNQIVAASALAHQAAWDVLTLADEARAAYEALREAGLPTDEDSHRAGVEISLRPLSTRRIQVSMDAVPSGNAPDERGRRELWRHAMATLRECGWEPRSVPQPDDPDGGWWPQATIGRRQPPVKTEE